MESNIQNFNMFDNGVAIHHNNNYDAKQISEYINRLTENKHLYPLFNENTKNIEIKFLKPEWYTELSEDLQYCIEYNIKTIYTDALKNYIYNMKKSKTNDDTRVSKKQRTE